MEPVLSKRVVAIANAASIQIAEKTAELKSRGINIIDLTRGEPDFATPVVIKQAAIQAMNENLTKYTSSRGIAELRNEIARFFETKKGTYIGSEEIIITPGGKQGIFYALASILNHGDEVIIPEPTWLSYGDMVKLNEGIPIFVPSKEDDEFIPPIEAINSRITKNTKAILINNPTNPTGALYGKSYVLELLELCVKRNILLISDEVYSDIVYDGAKFFSVLEAKSENTIYIGSASKMAAMTGWRIGFVIAARKIIDACVKMQQQTATCPSSVSQFAAIAAFRHYDTYALTMIQEYNQRRNIICEGINGIPKLSCLKPKGAFYVFVNVKMLGMNSEQATRLFLEEAFVGCVPGSAYGTSGEGYVRFCFATNENNILAALERIKTTL